MADGSHGHGVQLLDSTGQRRSLSPYCAHTNPLMGRKDALLRILRMP